MGVTMSKHLTFFFSQDRHTFGCFWNVMTSYQTVRSAVLVPSMSAHATWSPHVSFQTRQSICVSGHCLVLTVTCGIFRSSGGFAPWTHTRPCPGGSKYVQTPAVKGNDRRSLQIVPSAQFIYPSLTTWDFFSQVIMFDPYLLTLRKKVPCTRES